MTNREFLIIVGLMCILAAAPLYSLTQKPLVLVPIVVLFFFCYNDIEGLKEMKLTGRTRYRTGRTWWGKEIIVLEVEYTFTQTYLYGPMPDFTTVYKWRDATLTDLSMLKDKEFCE